MSFFRWAAAGSEKTRQQVQEYCGGGFGGAGAVPVNAGTYINVAAGQISCITALPLYN